MRNFNINNFIKLGFNNKSNVVTKIITRYCDPKNQYRVMEKLEELKVIDSISKHMNTETLNKVIEINNKNL